MKYTELSVGQRVYNRGDMANIEHWGTITAIVPPGRFSDCITIEPDEEEIQEYSISACMISDVDLGHGGTRIVTESSFLKRREELLRQLNSNSMEYCNK